MNIKKIIHCVALLSISSAFYVYLLSRKNSYFRYTFISHGLKTVKDLENSSLGSELKLLIDFDDDNAATRVRKCLKPHRHFAYIKTHKTGSTTVFNVLFRYMKKHSIKPALKTPNPFLGGYPAHIQKDLLFVTGSNSTIRHPDDGEEFVLIDHFRFNRTVLKESMLSDTLFVSVIRKPWNNFQSAFYYYYQNPQPFNSGLLHPTCYIYPYFHVAEGKIVELSEYIESAQTRLNKSVPWFFRSKNYQSHDLGLDPSLDNDIEIREAILKLNREIDLILITEYMDESMILLKDLFCMDWDDIIYENDGSIHKYNYTQYDDNLNLMKKFNQMYKLDIALYDHFNKTFWRKIETYGIDRMKEDVKKLKRLRLERFSNNKMSPLLIRTPNNILKRFTEESLKHLYNKVRSNNDQKFWEKILRMKVEKYEPRLNSSQLDLLAKVMTKNYGGCPV